MYTYIHLYVYIVDIHVWEKGFFIKNQKPHKKPHRFIIRCPSIQGLLYPLYARHTSCIRVTQQTHLSAMADSHVCHDCFKCLP